MTQGWNVKKKISNIASKYKTIGIYPEWNVKDLYNNVNFRTALIGIYPEWNVKKRMAQAMLSVDVNWNISRMECKAH